jgi:hypothetical protein
MVTKSKGLVLSDSLTIPAEAVTQTFAILAKRGAGKTYTASVLAEEMLKNNLPVVILDPIGVWWGLRSSADGKRPGLPIIIAGGDHADIPITPNNGTVMANLVVDQRLSVVIDFAHFRKGEQIKFVTDFSETLYHRNRNPLHLIVDEADAFAPQRTMPNEARMLGAMEDLVRRGRARGIGVTMITQRPAVLNKNVLTQIEVLIALRMTAPLDQKAIDEWIKTHAEEGQRETFMASLPSLPIGTAWFWSPGWLDTFECIKIRKRETLDSSSTPKVGSKQVQPRSMAKVDLEATRQQLAETIEKVEADDPKALRRRIIALERELAEKPQKVVEKVKEIRILTDKQVDDFTTAVNAMLDIGQEITKALRLYATPGTPQIKFSPELERSTKIFEPMKREDATVRRAYLESKDKPIDARVIDSGLRAGERRILETLAHHNPMKFTRTQVGSLSGFKASGGTFGQYFGTLKRSGFVEESGGLVSVTATGLEYVGVAPRRANSTDEILTMWRSALRAGEVKLLDELVAAYPGYLTKELLGELTGFTASGGTFGQYLGNLRRNGLVVVDDKQAVQASDSLFVTESQR